VQELECEIFNFTNFVTQFMHGSPDLSYFISENTLCGVKFRVSAAVTNPASFVSALC